MVCFTIWLIATEAMIFDQVKFDSGLSYSSKRLGHLALRR